MQASRWPNRVGGSARPSLHDRTRGHCSCERIDFGGASQFAVADKPFRSGHKCFAVAAECPAVVAGCPAVVAGCLAVATERLAVATERLAVATEGFRNAYLREPLFAAELWGWDGLRFSSAGKANFVATSGHFVATSRLAATAAKHFAAPRAILSAAQFNWVRAGRYTAAV